MKLLTKYRLLMVFIVILLIAAGSLMAFGNSMLPDPNQNLGKIMISRGNMA